MISPKDKTAPPIPFVDRDRAPVIFFDQSPTGAFANGIVSLTLSTDVFSTAADGSVFTEHAIVAHLKTSVAGLKSIREMLDKALLMAEPTAGEAN